MQLQKKEKKRSRHGSFALEVYREEWERRKYLHNCSLQYSEMNYVQAVQWQNEMLWKGKIDFPNCNVAHI